MELLIWLGAGLTVLGLLGLVYCIWRVLQSRKQGLAEEALKAELQRIVAMNLAALGVSGIGLAMVVTGIFLK